MIVWTKWNVRNAIKPHILLRCMRSIVPAHWINSHLGRLHLLQGLCSRICHPYTKCRDFQWLLHEMTKHQHPVRGPSNSPGLHSLAFPNNGLQHYHSSISQMIGSCHQPRAYRVWPAKIPVANFKHKNKSLRNVKYGDGEQVKHQLPLHIRMEESIFSL